MAVVISLELLKGRTLADRRHLAQYLAHDEESVGKHSVAIINTKEGSVGTQPVILQAGPR